MNELSHTWGQDHPLVMPEGQFRAEEDCKLVDPVGWLCSACR